MPKNRLRCDLLARRRGMDQLSWRTASDAAQQRLIRLDLFRQATCIALYSPIQQEIDTELLFIEARTTGKQILYPVVCGEELLFREVNEPGHRSIGSFGILEPGLQNRQVSLIEADLIVVPGVAFDLQGHRIGFGKGYYDRCLSQLTKKVPIAGLCHDFQLLDEIPAEGHDVRMQYVVTDKRMVIPSGEGQEPADAGLT